MDTRYLGDWLIVDTGTPTKAVLKPVLELRTRQKEKWWKKLTNTKHYKSYLNPQSLAEIDVGLSSTISTSLKQRTTKLGSLPNA